MRRFVFRPRLWGLALAACAAGIALGDWQARRAEEKRSLAGRIEAAARAPAIELPAHAASAGSLALRRIAVRGELDPRFTVLLDNRLNRGRPGYHVVQPLRIAGGTLHVLVLRGWIAAGARREQLPTFATSAGEQRIEGLALERLARRLEAGADNECPPSPGAPCVRQNLNIEAFGAWSGLALLPVVLEQASDSADGLVRDWPRPGAGHEKNEMYALQWYSLAALAVVLFAVLSVRRVPGR